jgi:hypothetical protein
MRLRLEHPVQRVKHSSPQVVGQVAHYLQQGSVTAVNVESIVDKNGFELKGDTLTPRVSRSLAGQVAPASVDGVRSDGA